MPLKDKLGNDTTLPILLQELKTDIQNNQARITALEEQIKTAVSQADVSPAEKSNELGMMNLSNFQDTKGRIDFSAYNNELKQAMYQTRQLTMAVRGYLLVAKEAGLAGTKEEQSAFGAN